MYNPIVRRTKTGVPILSKKELEQIAENFIADFCPEALENPMAIDVDRFARYVGLEQDFQYLSHCGCYLGMTVFNDTDKVPVFNFEKNQAEYISVKANTMIIDNSLLAENKIHRYNYTVCHEAAHKIFHAIYFLRNLVVLNSGSPLIQCRIEGKNIKRRSPSEWTAIETMEWQANYFSSAILMPKSMVEKLIRTLSIDTSYNRMVSIVSEVFNVSEESALYRLKGLDFVPDNVVYINSVVEMPTPVVITAS